MALVDMPGYGYAQAPKEHVDAWTKLVFDYLRGRSTLKRVYVLIDSRHGIKKNDDDVLNLLDKAAVSYQVRAHQNRQDQGPRRSTADCRNAGKDQEAARRLPGSSGDLLGKGSGNGRTARRHPRRDLDLTYIAVRYSMQRNFARHAVIATVTLPQHETCSMCLRGVAFRPLPMCQAFKEI